MNTLVRRARALRDPDDRERGSMPMLLLVMLVGLAFGALLIPMVITQDQTTRYDNSRTHSLHAAEAGMDAILGLVRNAVTDDGTGDTTALPCGPLSGPTDDGSSATYSVSVAYYTADPGPHAADPTWLASKKMLCVPGYGTYDPTTGGSVPSFALITSNGSDGPGLNGSVAGRTLQTTYVVKTTNSTTAGGIIRVFPSAGEANCLDAGPNPLPGTVVAVLVEEGAKLEKGAAILTLEVMKMEHTLRAPFAGVLKSVRCKVGDIVGEGVELAEIEASA